MRIMFAFTPSLSPEAIVQEIFSGIQGEGVLVGLRQIFVRFHGCPLRCRYCDTPASRAAPPASSTIEREAGSRALVSSPNPLSVDDVLSALRTLQAGFPHHSVSFTGGEPLLQRAFLDALLSALPALHLPGYLETNGVLAEELAALSTPPDYVAMDIKLPSTTGAAACWDAHAAFLDAALAQLARRPGAVTARLQVKIVFSDESLAEIDHAAQLIAACRDDIPCVLQPVTQRADGPASPRPSTVLEAQRRAAAHLSHVRVIPQTHVLLGQW